jgi:tetratricopeptide (TPR) repeat protein
MRSCIAVFYIALFWSPAAAQPAATQTAAVQNSVSPPDDPDALYRNRASIEQARSAAAVWEARLMRDARDFDAAWKLARVCYWLGNHEAQESARRTALDRGIAAGRQAVSIHGERPEGHFWIAANMGTLAESFGVRQGLKYRGEIRSELETVLRIDPGFQKGSADRALGRWYFKVPGLFGGSNKKSEEHLRKSLAYDNNSTVSHFFLAETLFDLDRDKEAIEELKKVLAVPSDPDWEPEDREYKQKATELLKKKL